MPFVLDASVALSWIMADETSETASAAATRLEAEAADVPGMWWFEIRNALLQAERRGRITSATVAAHLARLSTLPIRAAPPPDDDSLFDIARRLNLTIYDAAYLTLALQLRAPLATLDRRLAAAAQTAGVELF